MTCGKWKKGEKVKLDITRKEANVTVAVAVFNVADYLATCLDSILRQTIPPAQILLIDDGSTDGSDLICDEYGRRSAKVTVVHQRNRGLSSARNEAIVRSSCDWITFVDGDDFLESDMLEKLLKGAEDNSEADLVCCGAVKCNQFGSTLGMYKSTKQRIYLGEDQLKVLLSGDDIGTQTWGKLYRTKLFDDVRFPEGRLHEDVFTTYRILLKARSTACIGENLYCYRQRANSITSAAFNPRLLDSVYGCKQRAQDISGKYPELAGQARSTIVWACCNCFAKVCASGDLHCAAVPILRRGVQENLKYYIGNKNASILGKLYAVALALSPRLAFFANRTVSFRRGR